MSATLGDFFMLTACGPLEVTFEAEPSFLERDGIKINRNTVRKEFSTDVVGISGTPEMDNQEGKHSYIPRFAPR